MSGFTLICTAKNGYTSTDKKDLLTINDQSFSILFRKNIFKKLQVVILIIINVNEHKRTTNNLSLNFSFYCIFVIFQIKLLIIVLLWKFLSCTFPSPPSPLLWELTCDIVLYLILLLYFVQYLKLYFKVLSNIFFFYWKEKFSESIIPGVF